MELSQCFYQSSDLHVLIPYMQAFQNHKISESMYSPEKKLHFKLPYVFLMHTVLFERVLIKCLINLRLHEHEYVFRQDA